MLGTRFGPIWLLRVASIAALAALAVRLYPRQGWSRGAPRRPLWLLVLPAGALLLLTTTLSSHAVAAAQGGPAAWLADWLHLLGASVWVGGLAALAATLPLARRAGLAAALLRRFSTLALLSVAALALTGLYQAWLHVRTPSALLETPYGQALLVKLALLVAALALGAHNLLAARRPAAQVPVGRVRRAVWGELALLGAVLGAVGALTSLPPAWDVYRLANRGLVERVAVADLRLTLRVDPGAAGVNTFDLEVREQDGQPARQVQRVTLRLRPLLVELGESELRLAPAGEARYRGQGGYLSLPGYWQVELIVRRAGLEDARTALRLAVPSEPGGALPGARAAGAPGFSREVLIGLLVLALGAVLVVGSARVGRRRVWAGVVAMALGFVLSAVGTYAATTAWLGAGTALANPFPPDEASVRRGAEVYAQHCAACHGPSGRGDGPLALTVNPRPVDLRLHVTAHSETELFQFVSRGLAGTHMPAFADRLSADDRWHVVNYLRTAFDPQAGQQR
ncbi:MAG: CopD family protein [Chloroflexi bacterium]|nr:CopD family protein [Chloroflexota bacterium]